MPIVIEDLTTLAARIQRRLAETYGPTIRVWFEQAEPIDPALYPRSSEVMQAVFGPPTEQEIALKAFQEGCSRYSSQRQLAGEWVPDALTAELPPKPAPASLFGGQATWIPETEAARELPPLMGPSRFHAVCATIDAFEKIGELRLKALPNQPATPAADSPPPVCECGGDAAHTTHSTWCPKAT